MAETGDIPVKEFRCAMEPDSDSLAVEEEFDNSGALMVETSTTMMYGSKQAWPVWVSENDAFELIQLLANALNKRGWAVRIERESERSSTAGNSDVHD